MPIRRLIPLALALAVLGAAPPASADCDPAGPVERVLPKADVAFVGSVTATDGPVAQFAVAEVWAGDIPDTVEVRGISDHLAGRGGEAPVGEDDRLWTVGQIYLVVPTVDGGVLRDHICTATTEWSAELEPLRPANARIVAAEEAAGAAVPTELILVGAVVLVVGGASVLAFRRR
jgi:hypothetical protein